jgi:hypothetical protein
LAVDAEEWAEWTSRRNPERAYSDLFPEVSDTDGGLPEWAE